MRPVAGRRSTAGHEAAHVPSAANTRARHPDIVKRSFHV